MRKTFLFTIITVIVAVFHACDNVEFSTDGNLSSAMPSRPWVGRGRSTTEKKIAERGATAKKNKGR